MQILGWLFESLIIWPLLFGAGAVLVLLWLFLTALEIGIGYALGWRPEQDERG